uniref:Uncharacterized protein n=1 Tax=uncultured marine thaumarchaeote KM3_195_B01 TaxID=1456083 RepID=A0A075GSF4_9ARCH|nr:hypothetical protein [uncultured marine thaumarchaeote KM3_195_B01]
MSDQTEKPKDVLPKGYNADTPSTENTPSTDVVKQKKINFLELVRYTSTDQDQREKDLKEYEASYIARLEKNKPEESSDDFRVELGVSTESDDDLGKLNLRKHTVAKREELQEERLAYEQKYLDRYAEPKSKKRVSSSLYKPEKPKPKRDMKKERKDYEQKYLSRYKEPKQQKRVSSSLYKPEKPKPKRDMKKERKDYEQKYLSRYKQPKPGVKKLSNLKHDIGAGTLTLRQYINAKRKTKQDEIKKYEQKYLSRYKQPKLKKKASSSLYKPEKPKPKRDMKKERKDYEQKYLSRYKQPKPGVKKSTSWTQQDVALGRLTLSPHFNAKRRAKQNEIREYEQKYLSRYKEPKQQKRVSSSLYKPEKPKPKRDMKKERKDYEQKYLSRYKQPKANLRKPLNLKSDDLGRLNLRKHTIAKRSEYLAKRKDYEEKYILRYMKKRKAEPKRSSSKNLDHDLISGRLDLRAFVDKKRREIKTERTEYEKKYISKYKESKASIKKPKSLTESDDLGKFTISTKTTALKKLRAERAEYEKQYLARYSKQRKAKPKPKKKADSSLYKPEIPKPKRDMKKERAEYEQKYLARHLKQRKTKPKKKK